MESGTVAAVGLRPALRLLFLLALSGLTSCGGEEGTPDGSTAGIAETVTTGTGERALPVPVDRTFRVGSPKQELAIRCWGSGGPTVILDAGSSSGGIETFGVY
jgi:hypothetical protein